ncbi:MAG: hypothetical protein ACYDEF_09645 [Methanosarcina sp.]
MAKRRESKQRSRKVKETAENQIWWDSYCKIIAPNRIEVFDTNLLIDQRTYVRCLVVGLPKENGEGYPRDMTSKAIERIQELSFDGCKIMISHSLIQSRMKKQGRPCRKHLLPSMSIRNMQDR